MKFHLFLAAALGAFSLAACQQQPTEAPAEAPPVETASPSTTEPAVPGGDCAVLAQRDWQATGGSTLTVSGKIDLPTPGYSVSLARETSSATEATLALNLTPPSGVVTQIVTEHPIYYFGPADGQYTVVHVTCAGAALTDIPVTAP